MIFMEEEIAELLNMVSSRVKESGRYSAQASGPARLKKMEFLQNDPNCWALANSAPTEAQKIIIFSHSLLAERAPTSTELNLFQAFELFGYKVILWQGPAVPFSQYQPLSTSTEFWQKRDTTYPATEQAVKEALAQQGITLNGVVLDYANYQTLLRKLSTLETISSMLQKDINFFATCSSEYMDLSGLDLDDRQTVANLCKAVDVTKIKYVKLANPSLWSLIQKIFTHVISFTNFDFDADSDDLHPDLTELRIMRGCLTAPFLQAISELKKLHTLAIDGSTTCDAMGDLEWVCPDNLSSLTISVDLDLTVVTTSSSMLENFSSRTPLFKKFRCGSPQNIKCLIIKNEQVNLKNDLFKFTQLETLKIVNAKINVDAFHFPISLKNITLDNYIKVSQAATIDLSACNQLVSCTICNGWFNCLEPIIILPTNLKRLDVYGGLNLPNLSRLSQLVSCNLSNVNNLYSFEMLPKTLKKIALVNSLYYLAEYDFSPFFHLVDLHLTIYGESKVKIPAGLRKYSAYTIQQVDFSSCDRLEEIDYRTSMLSFSDIDMLLPKTLKRLVIVSMASEKKGIIFPYLPKLEELEIGGEYSYLDLSNNVDNIIRLADLGSDCVRIPSCSSLEYYSAEREIEEKSKTLGFKSAFMAFLPSGNPLSNCFSGCPNLREIYSFSLPLRLNYCESLSNFGKLFVAGNHQNERATIHFPQNKWLQKIGFFESKIGMFSAIVAPSVDAKQKRASALSLQNYRNPVSVYKHISKKVIDTNTTPSEGYTADGDFKAELITARAVTRDRYSIYIFNQIKVNERCEIEVSIQEDDEKNRELMEFKQAGYRPGLISEWKRIAEKLSPDHVHVFVAFEAIEKIDPKKYYPLPFLGIPDKNYFQIQVEPPNSVELFWSQASQQFKVKPREDVGKGVKVFFLGRQANHLLDMSLSSALLPKPLRDFLDQEIQKIPELGFLREELSKKDKINRLMAFCKSFSVEKLNQSPHNDFGKLLAIITEKKGVCRHRAYVFMILGRYIDVLTEMVVNEEHVYGRAFYRAANGQVEWQEYDLGGGERLDLTPLEKRASVLPKIVIQPTKINEPSASKYFAVYSAAAKKNQLQNIKQLTFNHALIELTNKHDPFLINKEIIFQLTQLGINTYREHLYIDHPDDFRHFFSTFKIDERGCYHKDVPGPLQAIFQKGGTLVINWSNFTLTDVRRYSAGLKRANRMLFDKPLCPAVCIISFKTAKMPASLFGSRIKVWELSPEFFNNHQPVVVCDEKAETSEIDLMQHISWQETFLGDIAFTEQGIQLSEGALFAACKKNQRLLIHNAPHDENFKRLIKRIQYEGKLLHNGEIVPVNIAVEVLPVKHLLPETLQNVVVAIDNPEDKRQRIYLGLYNIHECIERLVVHSDCLVTSEPGYLKDAEAFYVTESIPESEWSYLLHHIQQHYPDKTFHFMLAPGASISGVTAPQSALPSRNNVILTNDVDYASALLKDKYQAHIVHITPNTAYTDLVVELCLAIPEDGSPHVHGNYREKQVLQRLREEKQTVVLCGEPSPTLYQQLLPLLAGQYNQQPLNGQLFAVIPAETKLQLLQHKVQRYTFADYREILLAENKSDEKSLQQLEAFYQWADKLPKGGIGRPLDIQPSYHLLRRMLQKLRSPLLHPNNPIKGLFLYDYPRDSSDYAYLNVMAKYLLTGDHSGIRRYKLEKFKQLKKEQLAESIWNVLNCFNGQELRQLLGDDLSKSIDTTSFPKLTQATLDRVWEEISKSYLQAPSIEPTPDIAKKRRDQFAELRKREQFIFIKGEAGVGKTHAMKGNLDNIVFIDEANTKLPGQLDYLKSEARPRIATGNPEKYRGRYYHKILRDYAETIYFKKPTSAEERAILQGVLQQHQQVADEHILESLRGAYHLIQKLNPLYVFSLRDLINLGHRFTYLTASQQPESLFHACVTEFIGTLATADLREKFKDALAQQLEMKEENEESIFKITDQLVIDRKRKYIVDILTQGLAMRKFGVKAAVVLEAARGSRIEMILAAVLAQEHVIDIGVECTEQEILNKLADAFQAGQAVHLRGLNLMPNLEKILLHYLEGVDAKNQPPAQQGFFMIVTQLPSYEPGCTPLSQAFRNRTMHVNVDSASNLELVESARLAGVAEPYEAVVSFRLVQKEHSSIGLATFFDEFPRLVVQNGLLPAFNNRREGVSIRARDEFEPKSPDSARRSESSAPLTLLLEREPEVKSVEQQPDEKKGGEILQRCKTACADYLQHLQIEIKEALACYLPGTVDPVELSIIVHRGNTLKGWLGLSPVPAISLQIVENTLKEKFAEGLGADVKVLGAKLCEVGQYSLKEALEKYREMIALQKTLNQNNETEEKQLQDFHARLRCPDTKRILCKHRFQGSRAEAAFRKFAYACGMVVIAILGLTVVGIPAALYCYQKKIGCSDGHKFHAAMTSVKCPAPRV